MVEDGLITAVGQDAATRVTGTDGSPASSVEVVDAPGHTLTPGFVDAHVHLMVENLGGLDVVVKPFSLPFYESVASWSAPSP